MTVIVVERTTPALKGKLTRWMLEIHPGVFLGTFSARVRTELWRTVTGARGKLGACFLAYQAPTEQGFVIESFGDASRTVVDFDGLLLVRRRGKP